MSPQKPAPDRPTKGKRTRQRIVESAAALFNTRGFGGASMADVTQASGLEKGGVYNHFASKDELALAAFAYAAGLVHERLASAAAAQHDPVRKLVAMVDVYRDVASSPLLPGGCPLLNAAIEADDTNVVLRNRVRKAMDAWRALVASAVTDAVAAGSLRAVDPDTVASITIAALEGGIMLSSLYRDRSHMLAVVDHLQRWIESLAPA